MISKYNISISSFYYGKSIFKEIYIDMSYSDVMHIIYTSLRNFNNKDLSTKSIMTNIVDNILCKNNLNNTNFDSEYNVYISIYENKISITISDIYFEYIYEYKEVIANDYYAGNCVTDFCNKALACNIEVINEYITNIIDRHSIRVNSNNYHETLCYEQDYNQLSKIKDISKKIYELCNKELEHLSNKI